MKLLIRLIFLALIAVATSVPCDAATEHRQHERAETTASATEKVLIINVLPQRGSRTHDHFAQANLHCDSARLPIASVDISIRRQTENTYFVLLSSDGRGLSAMVDAEPPRISL
jgi:hypothetical protein